MIDPQIIIAFNTMVENHIAVLSKLSGVLLLGEIFIVFYLIKLRRITAQKLFLIIFLICAVSFGFLSMVFGYIADSALIYNMESFSQVSLWSPSKISETFVLLQMISVSLSIFLFVVAFVFYARTLADIMVKLGGFPSGGS